MRRGHSLVKARTVPVGMRIRKALGRAAVRQARQQGDKGERKSTRHIHSAKPCMSDFCHDFGSRTAFNYSMRHGQLTGGEAGKSNRRGQPIYLDRPRPLRCTYGRYLRNETAGVDG